MRLDLKRSGRWIAPTVAGLFVAASSRAQSSAPASASGRFATEKRSFDVQGVYAFWAKSGSSDHEPLLRVAVSNDRFKAEAFDAFYDPEKVINAHCADDETFVVYFEFDRSGRYHGLSYYFGSGDGCGFCYDSSVRSTAQIDRQRLAGTLSFKDERRSFDIRFDVPVPPREWGKPLPPDGGEPGKAVLAYQAAIESTDKKALFDLLDARGRELWKTREKEGKVDRALQYRWEKEHLELKDPRITGGFLRGDQAIVLVKGTNSYASLQGEVALRLEEGRWRIRDEIFGLGE